MKFQIWQENSDHVLGINHTPQQLLCQRHQEPQGAPVHELWSMLHIRTSTEDYRRRLSIHLLQWLSRLDVGSQIRQRWLHSTNWWIQNFTRWHSTKICFMGNLRDGVELWIDILKKRKISHVEECQCIGSVSIMLDKTMSPNQLLFVERFIATMCWECMYFQVDLMAGDGNKAAYLPTPKQPGVPSYEVSLLQFWINRMINTAIQSRLRHLGDSEPIRAKQFISSSYKDLVYLQHYLRKITLRSTLMNLLRRLKTTGVVAWRLFWNGDIEGKISLRMLVSLNNPMISGAARSIHVDWSQPRQDQYFSL